MKKIFPFLLLAGAGAAIYAFTRKEEETASEEPTPQKATVRRAASSTAFRNVKASGVTRSTFTGEGKRASTDGSSSRTAAASTFIKDGADTLEAPVLNNGFVKTGASSTGFSKAGVGGILL